MREQGPRRCLNQTLSKGREAFAHRLPRKELAPPPSKIPQHPVKKTRHKDGTAQIHEREEERSNRDITQHKERVRLERKEYQGNHVQEEVTLRNQVKRGRNYRNFHAGCVKCVVVHNFCPIYPGLWLLLNEEQNPQEIQSAVHSSMCLSSSALK